MTTAIPTPTVKKSADNQPMAEDICIGSIHADLVEHGVERVIEKWPELLPHQGLLESVVNAERCRSAHLRCAEAEGQAIDKTLAVLAEQFT